MDNFCKICNKKYKTYDSLYHHNKKFHNDSNHKCIYCKKEYVTKQSLMRHLSICDNNKTILCDNNKTSLCDNNKTSLCTNNIKGHNNTINNNINNTTNITNNNYIIQLGYENLSLFLSKNEKLKLLNMKHLCIEEIIKYIHFNDNFPLFKNIAITNMQNDIGYKYSDNDKKFITVKKDDLLYSILDERLGDITFFLGELDEYLNPEIRQYMTTFTDNMIDNKDNMFENKKKEIKLLIYNNRDKVNKNINYN